MTRRDNSKIAEELRQGDSAQTRKVAIATVGKALRRGDRFAPMWDAVGGAAGLASLMAEFSVRDVRAVCWWLGCTASAQNARPERRAALSELVRLLYDESGDQRPLRPLYQHIVPACSLEVVREWEDKHKVDWNDSQKKRLFYGHRQLHESKFLDTIFSPDNSLLTFEKEKALFRGNMPFCEEILQTLIAKEGHIQIPRDFISAFAMPLLKRLLKSRFTEETRNKFLELILQCFQKHPNSLGEQLNLRTDGPVQYVIQRWNDAPEDRKGQLRAYLVQLVGFFPKKEWSLSLNTIYQAILGRKRKPEAKYQLLRLFLQHMPGYGIDIEDESEAGLAHLRDLPVENDAWPVTIFSSLDNEKALRLFERLAKTYPSGDFLSITSGSAGRTVLKQARSPNEGGRGDVEVVRSLLMRDSKTKTEDTAWLERVRSLVHERRNKSQQSREPHDRAFWAKSALNLCVAAGDLETFGDTVLWARRFNKDPLTTKALYSGEIFETTELEHLLGAIPPRDTPAVATATASSVKKDIGLANRVVVSLIETVAMASGEPGFSRHNWLSLFRLPKLMADWRLKNADSFTDILKSSSTDDAGLEIIKALWKPTIDTLLEVEALLLGPTSSALGGSGSIEASAVYVFNELKLSPASALADLATFLLDQMKTRLGPEIMKVMMKNVVSVIVRVAHSDQPSLACPFIRDLIMNGDDNSSWHRQMVGVGFLSSLPAKAARDLLFAMADAMREKMREQNLRPRDNDEKEKAAGEPRPPAIKVTTVKMMAQLLQGTSFIDASSSCDILIGLLAEARHIDAQITIVNSLIYTMEEPTCPPELRTRILDAFEKYIVPVAAQLNERCPITEADWDIATTQDGAELPEVVAWNDLLTLLVEQFDNPCLDADVLMRFGQLIMSVLEQSAVNNSRWMNLFLAKNNFALDPNERLPSAPTCLVEFARIFEDWITYMPASLLVMLHTIVLTNIDPPPGIVRITKAVRANPDLVNSRAGHHWLDQFDNAPARLFDLGIDHAAIHLQRPAQHVVSKLGKGKGVTVLFLQYFALSVAERLTMKGDTLLLKTLVSKLCQNRFLGREEWISWRLNSAPIVKDIVAKIEAIRLDRKTYRGATAGSARMPLVLPNTFQLSVMALPIPYCSAREATLPEETDAFVSELSGLIDQLAKRGLPYHEDFARLKEEVLKAPGVSDFARFALKLDKVTSVEEPALADYLRVELAGDLLVKASDPIDDKVVRDARETVLKWKNSENEGLAVMGLSIADRLEKQGKKSWFMRNEKE
ncbi:hypothetical protein G7Z17_g6990 [Cylindrodendrum hubeiense]|uniref:Uncharacterized protein n=1 Tax=Cylindrodendrum hubeiense TaxID=595255 RepID=A0A9P5H6B1_9HYPO|nr:hypothetical protein G7Z17_g6990 [Cylindrodendrum hubeiense]